MNRSDIKEKFGFFSWQRDDEFVADCVWSEPYDNTKSYPKYPRQTDYGEGRRLYQLIFIEADNKREFVCAVELLTRQELAELVPYCPCYLCNLPSYDIRKYFACSHCFFCLDASEEEYDCDQRYVREARRRRAAGYPKHTPFPLWQILAFAIFCLLSFSLLAFRHLKLL